jgi:hypothetical protein
MLAATPIEIPDPADWPIWVVPAIGAAAACVVFFLGWLFSGAKRRASRRSAPRLSQPDTDPFAQGDPRDRRAALRRGGNPVAILISDAEARTKPSPGWVIDRSTGGLCLSVSDAVVEGTVLSVRTSNAPETIPWVQLEVKNCRAVGGEFELGCQFVRTPPWSVLLLFG